MEDPQYSEQARRQHGAPRKKISENDNQNVFKEKIKVKYIRLSLLALLLFSILPAAGNLQAQNQTPPIRPAILGQPMSDFSLPALSGGEFGISKLKGKNVLLVFPRGKVADHWCQICHYEYAELAEMEKIQGLRKKYDVEILFVLPYDKATVQHWVDIFPDQMAVIDGWKNPPETASAGQKNFAQTAKRLLPKAFRIQKGDIPTPFPILIDADQRVSKGLGLFTTNWDGSAIDQNVPTVFILDGAGTVRFKYLSQNTWDRPTAEYLAKVLDRMMSGR
jgi:peroxiredoxin